ncbi:hypothetical protein BKA69DRAFT_134903 [Paraphysoderma sedebokerense]|nr:hypothetical protein BKA69DRAFT_134903 [Paraphysoderma sedebokerense]
MKVLNTVNFDNPTCCGFIDLPIGIYILLGIKLVLGLASTVINGLLLSAASGPVTEFTTPFGPLIQVIEAALAFGIISLFFVILGIYGAYKKKINVFTAYCVYEILVFVATLIITVVFGVYSVTLLSVMAQFNLSASHYLQILIFPIVAMILMVVVSGYFLRVIQRYRRMMIEMNVGHLNIEMSSKLFA